MADESFTKIGHLKTVAGFRSHAQSLSLNLPADEQILSAAQMSPLAQPLILDNFTIGNRWCIHPMEGWDGTTAGEPTDHTLRRWHHFGESGAKLIWGGEAFAIQDNARANSHQIGVIDNNIPRAEKGALTLVSALVEAHRARFGQTSDLLVGLQLTHSGRFCRPFDKKKLEPKIAYHHPILDAKFGIRPDDDSVLLTDDDIERIIDNYVRAAKIAHRAGFAFVDIKHCHGYLGHEFLSAFTRKGKFGGDFNGRTRFAREIIGRIQAECPRLMIGVRLSAFDHPPFHPDPTQSHAGKLGPGIPDEFRAHLPYVYSFGCNPNNPLEIDLAEPIQFIRMLSGMGVKLINVTCGSPYYNPHIQRPAIFPPSDGYQPPEDPLIGVARQLQTTCQLKSACPNSLFVGSGYSYLQEYLPHVAQAAVRQNWTDFVGIGRLVLSYWDMIADTLTGHEFHPKRLCRTFSDCTTAPRNGIMSGCYPLDAHYKDAPEHTQLKAAKADLRMRLALKSE
jgi:NADPH2 dehydrogenase